MPPFSSLAGAANLVGSQHHKVGQATQHVQGRRGRQTIELLARTPRMIQSALARVFQGIGPRQPWGERFATVDAFAIQNRKHGIALFAADLGQQANDRQRRLLLIQIGSQGFAGYRFAAQHVEQVIGDLKRNA